MVQWRRTYSRHITERISCVCAQPGSSSMVGLFQELGPCRIRNDSTAVDLNPYSWSNNSNILFIDQPLGVGFSVSSSPAVGTSQDAAADVWKFLQIFLEDNRFSSLVNKKLAIWTESYVWFFLHQLTALRRLLCL